MTACGVACLFVGCAVLCGVRSVGRVAVVDLDGHVGSGTADILCRTLDPAFLYASLAVAGESLPVSMAVPAKKYSPCLVIRSFLCLYCLFALFVCTFCLYCLYVCLYFLYLQSKQTLDNGTYSSSSSLSSSISSSSPHRAPIFKHATIDRQTNRPPLGIYRANIFKPLPPPPLIQPCRPTTLGYIGQKARATHPPPPVKPHCIV